VRRFAASASSFDLDHQFQPGLPLEPYMRSEAHCFKPEEIGSLIHVRAHALTTLSSMAEVPSELLMLHASTPGTPTPRRRSNAGIPRAAVTAIAEG
jgi:hypothetical protein